MDKLRIVFMGTPDFSVPSLESLAQAGYDITAVYSQPDKQRGRGKKVTFSPVKEKALELGIPVFQPDSMRRDDVIEQLRSLAPDVIIVIAYGKILPKAVLDVPKYGCLNVHGSLLPKYRGAAPIQYAVKDGEAESGVTIMLEPLNTLVNHPGYYLWSAVEGFEIIREVNHPLVKLVYDIYHQQVMEGNIIPNITKNLDCIAHLHSAGHPGRNELQYGENDYKVIFAAVDKAGYTGACGLEYRPLMDPEESLREAKRLYGK